MPAPALANPYLPLPARIVRIQRMTPGHNVYQLRFLDPGVGSAWSHKPGQFVELSVLGVGECPISICSSPTRAGFIELCVRNAGRVTDALHRCTTHDLVGVRGPYGNGFPVAEMQGQDLLIVAGGLGMAPLRSLVGYALDQREHFGRITLVHGARTPQDMLFREELLSLMHVEGVDVLLTVDRDPQGTWPHAVGRLPELLGRVSADPRRTYAAVVGPPIVYRFVLSELLRLGFKKDRILMSLERRMKCGVGKCGHCTVGYKYTCLDGPIFTYWDVINLPEVV